MVDLKLDDDEGILLQANDVSVFKRNDFEEEAYELFLTNKNIVCCFEKATEKIPLTNIKSVNNKVQALKIDDSEYGLGLQLFLKNGERIHFVFSKKRELQLWLDTITGEKREDNSEEVVSQKEKVIINGLKKGFASTAAITKKTIKSIDNKMNDYVIKQQKYREKQDEKNIQIVEENEKERFCTSCGKKIIADSAFCNYCGKPVQENDIEKQKTKESNKSNERKKVYDGIIHKCPNCGEVLKSFNTNCPSCGIELRNLENSSSVSEFSKKIEDIEKKKSNTIIGTIMPIYDLSKASEKASMIRNYPIPNTKEDLLEFFILAGSNISTNIFDSQNTEVSSAWKSKFEQAYEKAKILFDGTEEFNKINELYNQKQQKIKNSQKALILGVIICVLLALSSAFLPWIIGSLFN